MTVRVRAEPKYEPPRWATRTGECRVVRYDDRWFLLFFRSISKLHYIFLLSVFVLDSLHVQVIFHSLQQTQKRLN